MRFRQVLGVILTIGVAASIFAGTASSARRAPATSANVWATQVCTSLKTWQSSLTKRSEAVSHLQVKSLARVHDAFAAFLDGVVKDTDTLIVATKAAGSPSVPQGAAISKALVTGFSKLRAYFAADAAKAHRLSKTNAQKFSTGAQAIGNTIDKQAKQLGSTFDGLDKKYHSPALDKAMKSQAACRGL